MPIVPPFLLCYNLSNLFLMNAPTLWVFFNAFPPTTSII
nr:MAG TPA: hypothetical protein [Caudoviricetes sp.]